MTLSKTARKASEDAEAYKPESMGRRIAKGALLTGGILGATYLHHKAIHGNTPIPRPGRPKPPPGRSSSSSAGGWGQRARGRSSPHDAPPIKPKGRAPPVPKWAEGAKTKAEYKNKYREQAKIHHPDRGGDLRKMQTLNAEHDAFTSHPESEFHKMSHVLASFFRELRFIYGEE